MSNARKPPRAALVLVTVAVLAAIIVGVLGFRTASSVPAGIPEGADLIGVSGTPVSRPIQPGFVGLSLEYTTVERYAGTDPNEINPAFVTLVKSLAPDGRPVLRIGGDSSDWGWWPVPGVRRRPGGIRYSLHRRFLRVTQALAKQTDARLIMGLNLEANNAKLLKVEADNLLRIGPKYVQAFEPGNEPEVFGAIQWYQDGPAHPVFGRPHGYGYKDFLADLARMIPGLPQSVALAGPASGGPKFWAQTADFVRREPRFKIITFHLYPLHRCFIGRHSPYTPSIDHLLTPFATGGLASQIARYVAPAHAHGDLVRVGEMNNVSCGGALGVSDRFVSALWALDMFFHLAREGVDGVNIHTFNKAHYRPFSARRVDGRWTMNVYPEYYGMLAFARAAPAGSRLLRVGPTSTPTLRVWATQAPDGHIRVTLINTSRQADRTVAVKLPGSPGTTAATLSRLQAPSLDSKEASLGGQSVASNTTSGELTGQPVLTHLRAVQRGVYVVSLPAGSAAILTR